MSWALIIGKEPNGYTELLEHVLNYETLCRGGNTSPVQMSEIVVEEMTGSCQAVNHLIDNKYYRADIQFIFVSPSTLSSGPFSSLSERCDAVVLLDDIQDVALEHEIFALIKAKDLEVNTKLLVTVTEKEEDVTDEHRGTRIDWCIDNQFEFIHIDRSNPVQGWESREKEGLPRLMEALSSTMWRSMAMKDRNSSTSATASITTVAAGAAEAKQQEPANDKKQANLQQAAEYMEAPDNAHIHVDALLSDQTQQYRRMGIEDDDDEEEDGLGMLNQLMQSVARIRDEALNGQTSDESRRARAAEMALRLAQSLGLDLDDDDDDDEVDEDSSV